MSESLRLDASEKAELVKRGFVLRSGVFAAAELRAMGDACEALVERLLTEKRRTKHALGSYMFELQRQLRTIVKWEPSDPELVQGLELFAHLSDSLHRWALDPRFLEPCKDLVGEEDIGLFSEKLNLKRAHKGGPIILHQDFPYWTGVTRDAARVATAMLFLDDATAKTDAWKLCQGAIGRDFHPAARWKAWAVWNRSREIRPRAAVAGTGQSGCGNFLRPLFWYTARCPTERAPTAALCSSATNHPDSPISETC
jgi:hypothetical protein